MVAQFKDFSAGMGASCHYITGPVLLRLDLDCDRAACGIQKIHDTQRYHNGECEMPKQGAAYKE